MSDSYSTDEPRVHSHRADGRALYERVCSGCGGVSLKIKRYIGLLCHSCAMDEKRNRVSPGSIQVDGGRGKISLFERTCSGCGITTLVSKKDKHRQCRQCALKARATHGLCSNGTMHPLYNIIKSAQARCDCPATKDYKWYGARGITVCQEWRTNPAAFVSWAIANGWKIGLELDRRDNDGNYCPENCRFITHKENCRNKSNSRKVSDE